MEANATAREPRREPMPLPVLPFSFNVTTTGLHAWAEAIVLALRVHFRTSYFRPVFGIAPHQGQFTVTVESSHRDAADPVNGLVPALLSALALALAGARQVIEDAKEFADEHADTVDTDNGPRTNRAGGLAARLDRFLGHGS